MKIQGRDRRSKHRFAIRRELHFKVLEGERAVATGSGQTIDMSSEGVAFEAAGKFKPGTLVQLSISWPVLLDETCLMQLMIVGRIVRAAKRAVACTIDRYEFRTQSRLAPNVNRVDKTIRRWIENVGKDTVSFAAEA